MSRKYILYPMPLPKAKSEMCRWAAFCTQRIKLMNTSLKYYGYFRDAEKT